MRPGLDFPGIAIAKETSVAYNLFREESRRGAFAL